MPAEDAAAFITPGDHVGMSGFTGSGHPKAVPAALVRRVTDAAERGDRFAVSVWTGSSTAPELDGALAAADGIDLRMPYQSDPVTRAKINGGLLGYLDVHLSHVAQMVRGGFFGHLDVAVVEVAGITAYGALIPSSSVGNNNTWIDMADRVILEVNLPALLVGEDHRGRLDKRSGLRRPVQARRSRFAAYRRSSPGLSEPRIQSRAAARHVAAASVRRG
jgi:succinyl-CoA:acetate CoA-transferase